MKILVIQQKMIGDVLASSIICNNLKVIYPVSIVDYLIYPFTKPVVEHNRNIDNIILFEEDYRKSKKAFFKFLISIRKANYDMIVDAYGKLESNLIVAFSGAKTKIGLYKPYSTFFYTNTINEIIQPLTNAGTALENRLNLVRLIAESNDFNLKPKIFLSDDEVSNGKHILENLNIDFSRKVIMIGIVGSGNSKTYPFSFMAQILDVIVQETQATLLFNCMPAQIKEAKAIYKLCVKETQKHIKIEYIPANIREFLSVTYHCDALIGNEGGAVNMAKAIDIPTFTIFSTWIIKEAWNSFEDGIKNVSVHLKDFKPKLYGEKTPKDMKKQALQLYQEFTPDLFEHLVRKFVSNPKVL